MNIIITALIIYLANLILWYLAINGANMFYVLVSFVLVIFSVENSGCQTVRCWPLSEFADLNMDMCHLIYL